MAPLAVKKESMDGYLNANEVGPTTAKPETSTVKDSSWALPAVAIMLAVTGVLLLGSMYLVYKLRRRRGPVWGDKGPSVMAADTESERSEGSRQDQLPPPATTVAASAETRKSIGLDAKMPTTTVSKVSGGSVALSKSKSGKSLMGGKKSAVAPPPPPPPAKTAVAKTPIKAAPGKAPIKKK